MSKRRSKEETLQNYRNMPDIYFVGDKRQKRFHSFDCTEIRSIAKADLYPCGPHPESVGFRRCQWCRPKLPEGVVRKERGKTKAEIMRQSLAELADRHRMHISFVGSNAVVTTIAGEWYFNYNIRPIQLHHKNNERRTDCYGRSTGHYHIQNVHPETPLEAMAYIYHHERSVEHYFFAPNFEHEMQEPLEILNPSDGVREDSCCDELERITLNKRNAPCKH